MSMVYAVPSSVPAPPGGGGGWSTLGMSWTGADGSEWELTNPQRGMFLMPGVRGLNMPTHTRYSSSSPAVAGSRHKGSRTEDRDIFWPLHLWSDVSSVAWMRYDRAFWKSLDPDREGTWTVHHPDGAKRSLRCRFMEADDTFEYDPINFGWATYGVRLLADNPFWTGQPVTRSWKPPTPRDFFVTAEDKVTYSDPDGTIFYLGSGSTLSSAVFTNEGDEPAYPTWVGVGPFTALTVGVEGQTLTIPFEVPEGKAVEIDTHPVTGQRLWFGDWNGSEVINRVNRTSELSGDQRFVPIPAGDSRKLSLTMTGAGIVKATIIPAYRRAW